MSDFYCSRKLLAIDFLLFTLHCSWIALSAVYGFEWSSRSMIWFTFAVCCLKCNKWACINANFIETKQNKANKKWKWSDNYDFDCIPLPLSIHSFSVSLSLFLQFEQYAWAVRIPFSANLNTKRRVNHTYEIHFKNKIVNNIIKKN